MNDTVISTDFRTLTAEIVRAHVSNNAVAVGDLSGLISKVYAALSEAGTSPVVEEVGQVPAVPIRASIKPDYIVCLEDGKKFKMLKRHLMTAYGMTPDAYRNKWNLPANYPMSAPNYAAQRRSLALKIGLGNRRAAGAPVTPEIAAPVAEKVASDAKPRARKPKAAADVAAKPRSRQKRVAV